MADRMKREQVGSQGGSTDAFVRLVIRYLDSPTDYREYLTYTDQQASLRQREGRKDKRRKNSIQPLSQKAGTQNKKCEVQESGLVLLDNTIPDCWRHRLWLITLIAILLCMLGLAWLQS
jgi:hypothetical protein